MSNKLYIGNLSYRATEEEVERLFQSCGEVVSVAIITDKNTGQSRGFGFVEMADESGKNKAIAELSETMFGGRNLRISEASERDRHDSHDQKSSTPDTKNLNMGTDTCIICGTDAEVFGYEDGKGVCAQCISNLSRASRPPRSSGQGYSHSGGDRYSRRY